ncbi:MAG: DUF2083 domain-containing protein, partial [Hyphomicrobiales bacterium]|nr:DUF2083 domain-containing protein [Hyphomicrobiales bacterium]
MEPLDTRKLFAGGRLRRLRAERGLTQTEMANRLGVSLSYLNLLERNQRPLTANVLLRLATAFDVEVRGFLESERRVSEADLVEVFADPALAHVPVSRAEVQELISTAPNAALAIETLYALWRRSAREADGAAEGARAPDGAAEASLDLAIERVRDHLVARENHFPELDALAERIAGDVAAEPGMLLAGLAARLRDLHGVRLRVMPAASMGGFLRRYDQSRRALNLSEAYDPASRSFQSAFQIGALEADSAIETALDEAAFVETRARGLMKVTLLNYFAAAMTMPYARFREAAEDLAYDIEALGARFEASFEQVCHRLTTLQRPRARGVAFFMLRMDAAGNVSKRLSAAEFPFSRFGGACPLWNVHAAFAAPGRVLTQTIEMPDGKRFFSVARTVERAGGPHDRPNPPSAVALVCHAGDAARLVYAR